MAALSVVTLPNNKGKIVYLTSAENIKFKRKILIGDKLNIETKLVSWKRGVGECFGQGFVKSELACQANFNIIVPVGRALDIDVIWDGFDIEKNLSRIIDVK
jgi:3-hydroxyacyl-[acyl-carrier-protein] dehydratase